MPRRLARVDDGSGVPRWVERSTSPGKVGVALVLATAIAVWLIATKDIPFVNPPFELNAAFEDAATLTDGAPVRIAGVNVGEVTGMERRGSDGPVTVTFSLSERGRPVRSDAHVKIRPRMFLEGNAFLDLSPGSPGAAELEEGATIPVTRTSRAVQLDQVLTALQSGQREQLQILIQEFGEGLTSLGDDADADPVARGESAAQSLNDAFRQGGPAARGAAEVNEALLGTEPRDLSRLIRSQARVFAALNARAIQLQSLVSNLSTTTGAFAAERQRLAASVRNLAPTLETAERSLARLDGILPQTRAFARELEPSVRELPATISASGPWIDQLAPALGERELGGLAARLRPLSLDLARAGGGAVRLFPRIDDLSVCAVRNVIPTLETPVDDGPFSTGKENYKEFFYSLVGLAGESQNLDGNGQYLRFQPSGGDLLTKSARIAGAALNDDEMFAKVISEPLGSRPVMPARKPPHRPDVRCRTQQPPDLTAASGPPSPSPTEPLGPPSPPPDPFPPPGEER